MPDDVAPLVSPPSFPTLPTVNSAPVAELPVDEAQAALDTATATIAPDEKPVEVEKSVSAAPLLMEHPISDTDAKKFTGTGDFNLPQSPLDDLSGVFGTTETKTQPVPEPTKTESMPTPPVDLEKKAEGMLKELNAAGGASPKKVKNSSATNRMALAAVLVVLMGAGGIVGVNLLKLQQSTENRSQAAYTGPPKFYNCSQFTGRNPVSCIPDNEDKYCNDAGQLCTYYIGECGWIDNGCLNDPYIPGDHGVEYCGSPYYCIPGGQCIRNEKCEYRQASNCVADPKCGGGGGPTPTPTITPEPLSCTSLTISAGVVGGKPALNDEVEFACTSASTGVNHYEFRYTTSAVVGDGTTAYISLASGTGNKSTKLKIDKKSKYTVQCRVCKSADTSKCTAWGAAR